MKKLSKWLTSLLVIAMALSMFGTTAFAADPVVADDGADSTISVLKSSSVTDATKFSTTDTYTFKLEATDFAKINDQYNAPTISNVTNFNGALTLTGSLANSATLTGSFDKMTFTAPGIYTFKVTETGTNNPNLTTDGSYYTVKVYVTYETVNNVPTTNLVARTTIVKSDASDADVTKDGTTTSSEAKVATCAFVNTANTNIHDLTVSKQVTGNTGSTTKEFTFTIDLTGVTGSYAISYTGTNAPTTPAQTTAADAGHTSETTITLTSGQTATITGLPDGAKYTVKETGETGYQGSYTINGGTAVNGTKGADLTTTEGTIGTTNTVAFTNNSYMTPPTAFVVNNWPYIALGIFAIAAIAIVLKKKSTKETF